MQFVVDNSRSWIVRWSGGSGIEELPVVGWVTWSESGITEPVVYNGSAAQLDQPMDWDRDMPEQVRVVFCTADRWEDAMNGQVSEEEAGRA